MYKILCNLLVTNICNLLVTYLIFYENFFSRCNPSNFGMMHRHFIIYKPFGYLSQFTYNLKRNKKLLGEVFDFPTGTMAIGRLDEDSEGLLLLTTDGMMSEIVRGKKVEKEYYVQVDGIIDGAAIEKLQTGVEIGFKGKRYTTLPCKAHILPEARAFPERGKKIQQITLYIR